MKIFLLRLSSVCFLSCFLLLLLVGTNVEAKELKIAVVDISGVFEKYEKREALDKELKGFEKDFQNEINKKKKEIINLDEETQLLDLGSDSRRKNEELLERKSVELEGYAKFAERQLLKRYREFFETVYGIVVKEVEVIGKKEGYDLIIKKEEPELKSGQMSDLQFKIGIRTVLYHSKAVDITSRVVDSLNASYRKSQGKK
ncbi:MAG: OmpH family outer membrane protein [Candidatus Scalindua sp. SCAELEC01]|nr:OmpH family outer membrane protein [Planctomycetota bacterium]RZV81503.1 MAG: OmpH family outer membrane protein [Candidatus Scalindua sp. SCAELEC01]